jgi:hypothetical protein
VSRRRKREGLPPPVQVLLLGSVLLLRVWFAVTDQAPPVPGWFVLAAAVTFGGSLGWMYHDLSARWRALKARLPWP